MNFMSAEGTVHELISGRLFISESDVAVFQCTEAVVAEGHAKDVRGEILEGLLAGADAGPTTAPRRYLRGSYKSRDRARVEVAA